MFQRYGFTEAGGAIKREWLMESGVERGTNTGTYGRQQRAWLRAVINKAHEAKTIPTTRPF
jgi:hypothetical protein